MNYNLYQENRQSKRVKTGGEARFKLTTRVLACKGYL